MKSIPVIEPPPGDTQKSKLVNPENPKSLVIVIVAIPVLPLKSNVGSSISTSGIVTPPDTDHFNVVPEFTTEPGDQDAFVEVVVKVICSTLGTGGAVTSMVQPLVIKLSYAG